MATPKVAIINCEVLPFIKSLFIARKGFYPKALYAYFHRPMGISKAILIYCADGKGWIQFQKERISIQARKVFIISKDTPHSHGADQDNPWTIYLFQFMGDY